MHNNVFYSNNKQLILRNHRSVKLIIPVGHVYGASTHIEMCLYIRYHEPWDAIF